MIWTNITTGTPVRATNAKTLSGALPGRTLVVRASHPGSGPDALLKVVNASGVVVSQLPLSAARPEPPEDLFEPVGANGVYNYILEPVGATWPSPGIAFQIATKETIDAASSYDPESNTTKFDGRTLSDRAVAKNAPSQGARKRVIIEGDSISSSYPPGQWPHIATMLNNGVDYVIVWSDSVSGTNLETMATRIPAIPSTIDADEVWVQGGTNADSSSGVGATAKNKQAIKDIAKNCVSRGWVPVFLATPPFNANVAAASDLNKWIAAWCQISGYRFVNIWVDSVDTTGAFKAASTYDGTHPTTAAHIAAAKRMNEHIRPGSSQAGFQPQQQLIETTSSSTINLATNPLCATSAGGVATGWSAPSGTGTSAPSIISAPSPMVGNLQKFVDSWAINGYQMHRRSGTTVIGGHRYLVIDYIRINSVTDGSATGQAVNISMSASGNNSGQINWGVAAKPGPAVVHVGAGFIVREILIPANDTQLTLGYQAQSYANSGSGTIDWDVGGHVIIDLTAAGL